MKTLLEKKVEEEESDEDNEELAALLADPNKSYDEKCAAVRQAMPLDSNAVFKTVLKSEEGARCLEWILQLNLNRAVAQDGATYDTGSASSALCSKLIHLLFTIKYVLKYKPYDPRETYVQQEGTAMDVVIYEWLKATMEKITGEFYGNFGIESAFDWKEFYAKFRKVWRWTRSNNSDTRKERRRKEREHKKN